MALLVSSCSGSPETETGTGPSDIETSAEVPVYGYKVVNTYPHDHSAYTQGLVFDSGFLYEGTGLRGHSTLRRVELTTGEILQVRKLPSRYFGEGVTIYGDRIIQLTWKSNVGLVFDKNSFNILGQFDYLSEGWGITHDGEYLIMSDGTSTLHYLEPDTFAEIETIDVHDDNGPVNRLNELEYINGEIYANVWRKDYIIRISPETGRVTGRIELKGILASEDISEQVDVLNGIAYDGKDDRLFVTGKLWPKVFEIVLVAPE